MSLPAAPSDPRAPVAASSQHQGARRPTRAVGVLRAADLPLARRIAQAIGAELLPLFETPGERPKQVFRRQFQRPATKGKAAPIQQWVLLLATGIAVRWLDGLLADKRTDPAVVVVDAAGRFAIPLVGGHEGGANRLSEEVAEALGAISVVTTASEAQKPLTLGLGFRRGLSEAHLRAALAHFEVDLSQVRQIATVDLKAQEPGLRSLCAATGISLRIFPSNALAERPFVSRQSRWVRQVTGAWGVCEPCALLASPRGRLSLGKSTWRGVAIALVDDALHSV